MPCEDDIAICNRECERLYGEQEAEMEEPCKLAVAAEFGGRGLCFPGTSLVQERRRGAIRMGDVRIGDELAGGSGSSSRIVAFLHSKAATAEVYLQIHYRRTDSSCGCLTVSPAHLVRAHTGIDSTSKRVHIERSTLAFSGWQWIAAEDVRPGNELEDARGERATVESINRACCVGAFAPLTTSGELLVDGVLCSCYAPPVAWEIPHSLCHAAMLPLRLLDNTKLAVEHWTRQDGLKDPLLTVDAIWLLPSVGDASLHPWASGLLHTAIAARSVAKRCKSFLPGERVTQPILATKARVQKV
jgi:hypothetical protein